MILLKYIFWLVAIMIKETDLLKKNGQLTTMSSYRELMKRGDINFAKLIKIEEVLENPPTTNGPTIWMEILE